MSGAVFEKKEERPHPETILNDVGRGSRLVSRCLAWVVAYFKFLVFFKDSPRSFKEQPPPPLSPEKKMKTKESMAAMEAASPCSTVSTDPICRICHENDRKVLAETKTVLLVY